MKIYLPIKIYLHEKTFSCNEPQGKLTGYFFKDKLTRAGFEPATPDWGGGGGGALKNVFIIQAKTDLMHWFLSTPQKTEEFYHEFVFQFVSFSLPWISAPESERWRPSVSQSLWCHYNYGQLCKVNFIVTLVTPSPGCGLPEIVSRWMSPVYRRVLLQQTSRRSAMV